VAAVEGSVWGVRHRLPHDRQELTSRRRADAAHRVGAGLAGDVSGVYGGRRGVRGGATTTAPSTRSHAVGWPRGLGCASLYGDFSHPQPKASAKSLVPKGRRHACPDYR
jgi:hypothetical protein